MNDASRRAAGRFSRAPWPAGALLGLGLNREPGPSRPSPRPADRRFKISLAEWSLHKALFAKKIDNLDFPKIAREQYGIEGVEFVNQFFKDKAHDSAYLKDLKTRANDHGVTCVLIMIDGEGDLSATDKAKRGQGRREPQEMGRRRRRPGLPLDPRQHRRALQPDRRRRRRRGVLGRSPSTAPSTRSTIICENHGGPSSDPDALIALMKAVNNPNFGTLPDFGNFPKDDDGKYKIDIYDAIARMMPYAKGVSAKSYDFDEKGNETTLDYARIMKIVTDAGYHGFVGIEYEGSRLSEPEGIKATKKLLESLREG